MRLLDAQLELVVPEDQAVLARVTGGLGALQQRRHVAVDRRQFLVRLPAQAAGVGGEIKVKLGGTRGRLAQRVAQTVEPAERRFRGQVPTHIPS